MAKVQTRRSISVRGSTYALLRDYCAGASLSMSDFVEQRIVEFFAARTSKEPLDDRAGTASARSSGRRTRVVGASFTREKLPGRRSDKRQPLQSVQQLPQASPAPVTIDQRTRPGPRPAAEVVAPRGYVVICF